MRTVLFVAALFCFGLAVRTNSPMFLWSSKNLLDGKKTVNVPTDQKTINTSILNILKQESEVVVLFLEQQMTSECFITNSSTDEIKALNAFTSASTSSVEYSYVLDNGSLTVDDLGDVEYTLFIDNNNKPNPSYSLIDKAKTTLDISTIEQHFTDETTVYNNEKTDVYVVVLPFADCPKTIENVQLVNKVVTIIKAKTATTSHTLSYGGNRGVSAEEYQKLLKEEQQNSITSPVKIFWTQGALAGFITIFIMGCILTFGMYFLLNTQSILDDVDLAKQKVL